MKPLFRITMSMACLALLLWGGVAVPAETPPCPENCEYLMKVIEGYSCPESCEYLMTAVEEYPGWGVADVVPSDQMEAATALSYGNSETEWEWVEPVEPMVAGVIPPEPGTYEYSIAMETGNLPSACAGEVCPPEQFTIIEVGTLRYRLGIDDGGN